MSLENNYTTVIARNEVTRQSKAIYKYVFSLLIISIFVSISAHAQYSEVQLSAVLVPAESFFKSLKEKNDSKAWMLLSQKSQNTIIDDILREIRKNQSPQTPAEGYSKAQIDADLKIGGSISKSYWNAFRQSFDPDLALEQSAWNIGFIKKDNAEIIIQYKKSDNPATLKMFKESGVWKVGLVETFWTRK